MLSLKCHSNICDVKCFVLNRSRTVVFISQKKQKGVVNRIMIEREEMTRVTEHDAKKNTQNSILIYFAVYLTNISLF